MVGTGARGYRSRLAVSKADGSAMLQATALGSSSQRGLRAPYFHDAGIFKYGKDKQTLSLCIIFGYYTRF